MRKLTIACLLASFALPAALLGCGEGGGEQPPRSFFGVDPQEPPSEEDARYMRAGGIDSVRWPLPWSGSQPEAGGEYSWASFDPVVEAAAKQQLRVLPFIYSTPAWLGESTELPVENERQRRSWRRFLVAAVERYGPNGSFWREHESGAEKLPKTPIREWQIWNEANFFYFAKPVAPQHYARLVQESHRALSEADPGAKLILSGLFADPKQEPPKAMDATRFLQGVYETEGISEDFDGIALHPYARDTSRLEELVTEFRAVPEENGDAGVPLYITEMGWGSQSESEVSFEKGPEGQAEELSDAYEYLASNRKALGLQAVYWFSWQDKRGSCNFCDSTGLFAEGEPLQPKLAWQDFVEASGGEAEP